MLLTPSSTEEKYWLALSQFSNIGPIRFKKLIDHFSSAEKSFYASNNDLKKIGFHSNLIASFTNDQKSISPDQKIEELKKNKINFVTFNNPLYPPLLREIYDAPPILYYWGTLPNQKLNISFVGSRLMTNYGKTVIEKIIRELSPFNFHTISGLARGVDTHVHEETIKNHCKTTAVIASGLKKENLFPKENWKLVEKILANNGCVLTEYPPETIAWKTNFPQRNRLISGLSSATVIIEAGQKSGALITAQCAVEQNREILAVPGSIFSSQSQGCLHLIKEGAKVYQNIDDILEIYQIKTNPLVPVNIISTVKKQYSPEEEKITSLIKEKALPIDLIIKKTNLPSQQISSLLAIMEIDGKIKNKNGYIFLEE